MDMININGSEDVSYRYKMSKLLVSNEGTKTIIHNLKNVCDDIALGGLDLMLKYFEFKLNKPFSNQDDSNKFVIEGDYTYEQLFSILKSFIDLLVICPKCTLPETYIIQSSQQFSIKCTACGKTTSLDEDESFTQYHFQNLESDV